MTESVEKEPLSRKERELIEILGQAASAVEGALQEAGDWGPASRPGQYRSDLVADEAAISVLHGAGLKVLSEESALTEPPSSKGTHGGQASSGAPWPEGYLVVVDPLDGSTNASRGIPWFATSLCVLDEKGPLAAVVLNLASRVRYTAVRGRGAKRDGRTITSSGVGVLAKAVVGVSGYPRRYLGWKQFRALGAVALDLCAVADGTLDGYVDCGRDAHGAWDYLGGLLVCREAGAVVVDALGRDLELRTHDGRRTPVAGATQAIAEALLEARKVAYETSS